MIFFLSEVASQLSGENIITTENKNNFNFFFFKSIGASALFRTL